MGLDGWLRLDAIGWDRMGLAGNGLDTYEWMGLDEIKWDWMGLDGIRWDWMGLYGIRWD